MYYTLNVEVECPHVELYVKRYFWQNLHRKSKREIRKTYNNSSWINNCDILITDIYLNGNLIYHK